MNVIPVDRGDPHDWSEETLEDGSRWCNDPGCAMFKWPDGFVGPWRNDDEE